MIFNKKIKKKKKKKRGPSVINGAHLHTLTLVMCAELAFSELEGRKRG